MRRVIVESPYRGGLLQRWRNRRYARACIRDCLMRGEAPLASHLLYTQPGVLRDHVAGERQMGIEAGHAWINVADAVVLYVPTSGVITPGMNLGIKRAKAVRIPVEYRRLERA
jgi:hypothetical protein